LILHLELTVLEGSNRGRTGCVEEVHNRSSRAPWLASFCGLPNYRKPPQTSCRQSFRM